MSMRDRLQAANAPAWIPETKGDLLCGVVANVSSRSTDYGDYPIVTVALTGKDAEATVKGSADFTVKTAEGDEPWAGGPLAFHAMGSVAANEIERSNPQVGDEIGILYDGTAIAQQGQGKGKSYRIFRVVVDHVAPSAPLGSEKVPGPGSLAAAGEKDEEKVQSAPASYVPEDEEPF